MNPKLLAFPAWLTPALAVAVLASPALGQSQAQRRGPASGEIRVQPADAAADTRLPDVIITGQIVKPGLFILFSRAAISVQGIEIKQAFSDRIVRDALRVRW